MRTGGAPMTSEIARKIVTAFQSPAPNADAAMLSAREIEILELLSQGRVSKEIADCIYTALLTDTGSFHFSNTTERTLKIASAAKDTGR